MYEHAYSELCGMLRFRMSFSRNASTHIDKITSMCYNFLVNVKTNY